MPTPARALLVALVTCALALTTCVRPNGDADGGDALAPGDAEGASVARGQYLVDAVLVCGSCHTPAGADGRPDPTRYLAGALGSDARHAGSSGARSRGAGDLTSDPVRGLGAWTDDQIRWAIVATDDDLDDPWTAVAYPEYAMLTDEDVDSIVMYLRTVPSSARGAGPR